MDQRPGCLELFGVIHVDQHRKVQRELAPLVADADAICLEAPEPLDRETAVGAAGRAPLWTLGAFLIQLFAYLPLYLLFNHDTRSTEEVAVSNLAGDRPVYRVDRNPVEFLAAAGPAVVAFNWVVLVALTVLAPVQTALTVGVVGGCLVAPGLVRRFVHPGVGVGLAVAGLVVAYWLLLAGPLSLVPVGLAAMLALVVVVHSTVDRRNGTMLDNTLDRAAAGEHDRVVLVTGKAHLSGMVPLARERGVEVGRVHVSRWLRTGRTYDGQPTGDDGVDPAAMGERQASMSQRLRAGAVDAAVILALWLVVAGVVLGARAPLAPGTAVTLLVALGVLVVGYRGLGEATAGTVGQQREGLQVVTAAGRPVGLQRALARNALLSVDVLLLFVPAILDERNRLVCEHLTRTHVLKRPD